MLSRKLSSILFAFFYLSFAGAQVQIPFDSEQWTIQAQKHELTEYKGKKALLLTSGAALLEEAKFKNGVIEWDMAFPEERGFTGVRFRVEDSRNSEEFYFRPHQSGKADANQYCPVDNGLATWQLYHGEAYSVAYAYNFNEWFHVKLVVAGSRAELYIDDMKKPVLHIPFLKRKPVEGQLMVYGSRVPTYFANFSYQSMDKPTLVNSPVAEEVMEPSTIPTWSVSNPFPSTWTDQAHSLEDVKTDQFKWQSLKAEASGTANLGIVSDFEQEKRNTVFAKVVLRSASEQIKALHIGFSDRAKVYCNGRAVFSGNDTYRTRDYRYLGTIGYFDTVYLPLKKGENEVWIAVTESFGGWGVRGKLENMEGVEMVGK